MLAKCLWDRQMFRPWLSGSIYHGLVVIVGYGNCFWISSDTTSNHPSSSTTIFPLTVTKIHRHRSMSSWAAPLLGSTSQNAHSHPFAFWFEINTNFNDFVNRFRCQSVLWKLHSRKSIERAYPLGGFCTAMSPGSVQEDDWRVTTGSIVVRRELGKFPWSRSSRNVLALSVRRWLSS